MAAAAKNRLQMGTDMLLSRRLPEVVPARRLDERNPGLVTEKPKLMEM
jgi:hypothetical protein